jgi:hypothetical protein
MPAISFSPMRYRLGKEPTMAAVTAAKQWIKEL